jgi:hypothetical protein
MITAAKAVKQSAREEAARDIGGDLRMSNVGRRGARLRAVDTVRTSGTVTTGKVVGLPVGLWSLVTDGAAPHMIRRRRGGKRRAQRGVLLVDGRPVTGPVRHPGTSGKGTWRRVRRRAERDVPRAYAKAVREVLR